MPGKRLERVIRGVLLLLIISLLVWAFMEGAFRFILDNPEDVSHLLGQHLKLIGLSALLAVMAAVPAGILVTRVKFQKYRWIVVNFVNIGQTVPSLAVLALVMSFFGIGYTTAVFALWLYSLLPILRNTMAGIENVDKSVIDAGRGMGMTPRQIFWKVEFPNALYAILAGIRTSIVINVGTAALAFLVGGGGLGDLIFTGISLFDTGIMLAGALPVTLLAVMFDFILGKLEKLIIPKGLQRHLETI